MKVRIFAALATAVLSVFAATAIQAQGRGNEPSVAFRVVGTFVSLNSTTPSITVQNGTPTSVVIPITSAVVKEAEKLKAGDLIEIDFSAAGPNNLPMLGVGGPQPPRVLMLRKTSKPGCSCDGGNEANNACEKGWECKPISVYGFTCGCTKQ
jgi:hypothetical protein